MFRHVLVVCIGNVCRSPMAEALLARRLAGRGVTVESAGLGALEGQPAADLARELLAERGIDLSAHRGRQLTPEVLARCDLVLVMTANQQRELEKLAPQARGRVHLLGKFGGFEVPDPYRQGRPAFEAALALIERGVDDYARRFWPDAR